MSGADARGVLKDVAQVGELVVEGEFLTWVAAALVDRYAPGVERCKLFDACVVLPPARFEPSELFGVAVMEGEHGGPHLCSPEAACGRVGGLDPRGWLGH